MPFDPFRRLRPRARPLSSCEHDSDESSPERTQPRIVHVPIPKSDRKSADHLLGIPDDARIATDKLREGTCIALTLDSHQERTSKKPSKFGVTSITTNSADALQPTLKPTLIRRVTSKLNITIPSRSGTHALQSRLSTRTLATDSAPSPQGSRSPRATAPAPPILPNGFTSKQHREAALRERGLRPPHKDLSQQEREADDHLVCAPSPVNVAFDGTSEAEQFKASWLAVNRSSESSDPGRSPLTPPHSQLAWSPSVSVPTPDVGVGRRSGEGKMDIPPAGRPSFCSSLPPLSTSSCLEVLHEEPSEQGLITPPPPLPPAKLPIIISSPLDSPSFSVFVESPISCTFSSHCAGSTFESQSQSSHPPPVPEKDSVRFPTSRRRTSESYDRPHKFIGLSRLGTHSLTNLRRSVIGSMKVPSASTLSIGRQSSSSITQVPRAALDPTIHSMGSILRETKDIQDAESRRLSELAFLD